MKRIANSSKTKLLLMFKHQDVVNEAFQGDASNEKFEFIEVDNGFDNIFLDSNMFPPKRGQQDVVKLHKHASFLGSDVTKMPMQESAKIKEKTQKKFDKEGIRFKISS